MTTPRRTRAGANVGASAPASAKKAEAVNVLAEDGSIVRTYSKEVHGDNFIALAEEFVGKKSNGGVKIVAA